MLIKLMKIPRCTDIITPKGFFFGGGGAYRETLIFHCIMKKKNRGFPPLDFSFGEYIPAIIIPT